MEYRRLGTTGMQVSAISLGAWLTYGSDVMSLDAARACVRTAIEAGINFIDLADVYSRGQAEETVGQIIKDYNRQHLVISTKAFGPMSDDVNDRGLSRKHIFESVHQSLQRLQTDYIDIFFCHRYDTLTPTDETVRAIEDLIRAGKIHYWGTSMWNAEQLGEAVQDADRFNAYRPVIEQPLYNMLDRNVVEGELEQALTDYQIGLVVWSPLAGGLLTGKYDEGVPEDSRAQRAKEDWMKEQFSEHRLEKARAISALAREYGTSPASLALAWAMNHPHVDSVITGATRPEQVTDNLKALDVDITPELEAKIEEVLANRPYNSQRPTKAEGLVREQYVEGESGVS